jgi:hypothetical protein
VTATDEVESCNVEGEDWELHSQAFGDSSRKNGQIFKAS